MVMEFSFFERTIRKRPECQRTALQQTRLPVGGIRAALQQARPKDRAQSEVEGLTVARCDVLYNSAREG